MISRFSAVDTPASDPNPASSGRFFMSNYVILDLRRYLVEQNWERFTPWS